MFKVLIKNLIHSNLTFDQETKENFLLFFFKFFTGNLEHQILEENQIIESIYSKFEEKIKRDFTFGRNEFENYIEYLCRKNISVVPSKC